MILQERKMLKDLDGYAYRQQDVNIHNPNKQMRILKLK